MNELVFTVTPQDGGWQVEGRMSDSSSMPKEIFLYENFGGTALGAFAGVTSSEEFYRSPVWVGQPLPKFGNRYVKYDRAKIKAKDKKEVDTFISKVTASVKLLKQQLEALPAYTITIQI